MNGIIISGISGKMGMNVYEAATKRGIETVCGIDKNLSAKVDCPVFKSFDEVNDVADVIIDFSSPECLENIMFFAMENKMPVVLGTTGYNENQNIFIEKCSSKVAIFKSANMSLGVNLLCKLLNAAAAALSDYDVEIIDTHHNQKKDSPSGTTYLLLKSIQDTIQDEKTPIFGRKGKTKRSKKEIGIHSVRGGNVVGEHEVIFFGESEYISFKHTALSKQLFADGAIKAAKFICNKPSGLYSMDDLV